jgi:hypothetical protein
LVYSESEWKTAFTARRARHESAGCDLNFFRSARVEPRRACGEREAEHMKSDETR